MLLVAVSGGIDSMCLAQKVRLEGGPFAVAHCNFGLRGEESDADEAFVRAWCSLNGIPLHVKRFDTQAFATAEGISVEMAARRLRYHWFGELCREHGYEAVAVAHNANDNAETLLLNLLRGTGLRGITGMKPSGFLPDPDFGDIPLLRPLLGMTRADIEAFAADQGLSWRDDSTNALNDYKRNKIRNLVFPIFAKINPSFIQTLNRDMERFSEEMTAGVALDQVQSAVDQVQGGGGPGPILGAGPGPILGAGPGPASMASTGLGGTSGGPGPVGKNGPSPNVGWTRSKQGVDQVQGAVDQVQEYTITEEEWDGTKDVKQPEGMLVLDKEKAGEWAEGRWETGDWIRPLGAPGKKKMQDWFTDHHIPADEKPFVPLLKSARDPHHVLAVVGHCIDHSVRVTKSTRQILRISTKNL
jgi:tRNA(Ile)-lysidine synthase